MNHLYVAIISLIELNLFNFNILTLMSQRDGTKNGGRYINLVLYGFCKLFQVGFENFG